MPKSSSSSMTSERTPWLRGRVIGIDGCPGGTWVAVEAELDSAHRPRKLSVRVVDDLAPTIKRLRAGELQAVAIDMPIGLLDDRPRASDGAARALLGPRRSSVFPTPVRAVLDTVDYADACNRSRQACGRAISKQAFYLLPRIRLLDDLVEPSDQDRLVEAHPELAFVRLNREPLQTSKHTAEGRAIRRELLSEELTKRDLARVLDSRCAPLPDLLDATSLVTTATRVATASETRLGTETDATGKRAEVVF